MITSLKNFKEYDINILKKYHNTYVIINDDFKNSISIRGKARILNNLKKIILKNVSINKDFIDIFINLKNITFRHRHKLLIIKKTIKSFEYYNIYDEKYFGKPTIEEFNNLKKEVEDGFKWFQIYMNNNFKDLNDSEKLYLEILKRG